MSETNQIVVFSLNNQQYALPIKNVSEIIRMMKVTRIPKAKSYYLGIINLRDSVISVMSLSMRLGMDDNELTGDSRIIVSEVDAKKTGFIVDSVHSVIRYSIDELESFDATENSGDFLTGVLRKEDDIILLLSPEKILNG